MKRLPRSTGSLVPTDRRFFVSQHAAAGDLLRLRRAPSSDLLSRICKSALFNIHISPLLSSFLTDFGNPSTLTALYRLSCIMSTDFFGIRSTGADSPAWKTLRVYHTGPPTPGGFRLCRLAAGPVLKREFFDFVSRFLGTWAGPAQGLDRMVKDPRQSGAPGGALSIGRSQAVSVARSTRTAFPPLLPRYAPRPGDRQRAALSGRTPPR